MTQLVLPERVKVARYFDSVRGAVAGEYRRRFRGLAGYVVYVSIHGDWVPESPKIVEALASYEPPKERYDEDSDDPLRGITLGRGDGFTLSAAKLDATYSSPYFESMGFELVLCLSSETTEERAWEELTRRLADHDKTGVDDLLVAAGAPISGLVFPTDAVLAGLALGRAQSEALEAADVKRIFLHVWAWRSLFELIPGRAGFRQLCGDVP